MGDRAHDQGNSPTRRACGHPQTTARRNDRSLGARRRSDSGQAELASADSPWSRSRQNPANQPPSCPAGYDAFLSAVRRYQSRQGSCVVFAGPLGFAVIRWSAISKASRRRYSVDGGSVLGGCSTTCCARCGPTTRRQFMGCMPDMPRLTSSTSAPLSSPCWIRTATWRRGLGRRLLRESEAWSSGRRRWARPRPAAGSTAAGATAASRRLRGKHGRGRGRRLRPRGPSGDDRRRPSARCRAPAGPSARRGPW